MFIKQLSIPAHLTILLLSLLLSISCNIFVHFVSKPLDLDQMGMGWIGNNSVDKNRFLIEKLFSSQCSVALINSILTIFIIDMKTLSNSKMK